jgi:YD repeat-containing protein
MRGGVGDLTAQVRRCKHLVLLCIIRKRENDPLVSNPSDRKRSAMTTHSLTRFPWCGATRFVACIVSVFLAPVVFAQIYSYSDCQEAGGRHICNEPHIGPWDVHNASFCNGPFLTEEEAVTCSKAALRNSLNPQRCSGTAICSMTYTDGPWGFNGYTVPGWLSYQRRLIHYSAVLKDASCALCNGVVEHFLEVQRWRKVDCTTPFLHTVQRPDFMTLCLLNQVPPHPVTPGGNSCERPQTPHPIRLNDRAKVLHETDYAAASGALLRLDRTYASGRSSQGGEATTGLGSRWSHNFDRRITTNTLVNPQVAMHVTSRDQVRPFIAGIGTWTAAQEVSGTLKEMVAGGQRSGWRFVDDTAVDEFDAAGTLLAITGHTGQRIALTYTARGDLASVTDHFGRVLTFTHVFNAAASRKLSTTVSGPDGLLVRYYFDDASAAGEGGPENISFDLTAAQYADGTIRRYHYAELELIASGSAGAWRHNLLTGITDESGVRYAKYSYDHRQLALGTELAGGVATYTLSALNPVTVVDPLGTSRSYAFARGQLISVTQPAGAGSAACAQSQLFDAGTSLLTERETFDGTLTCFQYDTTRRLQTKVLTGQQGKTGFGYCSASAFTTPPAGARLTSTQWHPDWRLESRRAEPKRILTSVYNGQPDPTAGNMIASCAPVDALVDGKPIAVLCKQVEQGTNDETGAQGFAAPGVGSARVSTWTYNRWGQVLTAKGPRTDVDDTTVYAYYPDTTADWTQGDLARVTNAAGHVTRFPKYNPHGQVLERRDPNGLVTTYTYDRRQRLTAQQVGTERTTFTYDSMGNLTAVTLPDGSGVTYTYDAAHRLMQVQDVAGNTIVYTLDAMGNHTREEVRDPGGQLTQSLSQVYDALNRLQQITGGTTH